MRWYTPVLPPVVAMAAMVLVSSLAAAPPNKVIRMTQSMTFDPKTVTIKAGETVVWKNVSDLTHSVTDDPALATSAQDAALPPGAEKFNSGLLSGGKEFSHTFKFPGTYKYFCIPHEEAGMVGTVVVAK